MPLVIILAAVLFFPPLASAGDLSPYSTLLVHDFSADTAQISNVPPDVEETFLLIRQKMVDALANDLVTYLTETFPAVSRSGDRGGSGGKSAVIEGRFSAIDAGRRGLRMWIGFSGTASAAIQARIIDGKSGKVLAIFEQGYSAPLGWAGSERVLLEITDRLAAALAEFVKKLR